MPSDEDVKRLTEDLKRINENLNRLIELANIKMREINRLLQREPEPEAKSTVPPQQQAPYAHRGPAMPRPAQHEEGEKQFTPTEIRQISTGVEKLDELLVGGVRTSSNALLQGPPYSNKYVLAWNFVAQALKENTPVIVITTDKDIREIKYEVGQITGNVEEAEEKGLLKFIDVYSRSMQSASPSPSAIVIDNIINISSLLKAVDQTSAKMREEHPYYRLLFSSLTSYVNELDEKVLLKFIQQFVQKRKSENCFSFNILESSLFEKKVIEAISYLMDGSIQFKSEGAKTYLKVDGLGNARSREWVEIYPMDTSFDLGAFTLEKIK